MTRVVIDIPDNEYCTIKEMNLTLHTEMLKGSIKDWEKANTILNLLESVKSGIVLSKGHGDLIDREEFLKTFLDSFWNVPTVIEADKEKADENS